MTLPWPKNTTWATAFFDYDTFMGKSIEINIGKYKYRNAVRTYNFKCSNLPMEQLHYAMEQRLLQRFWRMLGAA